MKIFLSHFIDIGEYGFSKHNEPGTVQVGAALKTQYNLRGGGTFNILKNHVFPKKNRFKNGYSLSSVETRCLAQQ